MMPVWPELLPLPTIDGYSVSPQDGILRTAMDMGPARQRRRYTTTPTRIAVRWLMNAEQCALFEGWYRWYAKEGGSWFDITLLGGLGLTLHQARFTKPYEAHLKGGRLWEIMSELEVRERPTLSHDIVMLMVSEDVSKLTEEAENFHLFVHQTLPRIFN